MPLYQRTSVAVLLGVLFMLMTACAARHDLEDPTFRLAGVEPLTIGLLEQQFRLTIRVDNPNNVSLPVRSMRYQLELANVDFASGMTPRSFNLPARDSTTFEVDVTTNLMESLPRLISKLDSGRQSLDYTLKGEVEYGRFFRGKRPFEQKGELRLR